MINRGNGRAEVFHDEADLAGFVGLMAESSVRVPMRVVAYCVMPNHFHLVLWPRGEGDLGRWMHWLLTTHVRRYRRKYGQSGHVWQGRFKAFPVQEDEHLVSVVRYVERNALRAGLVERAETWPWCSVCADTALTVAGVSFIARGPRWVEYVNAPMTAKESDAIRRSILKGSPFGTTGWILETARVLGLESTLRAPGRPCKDESF